MKKTLTLLSAVILISGFCFAQTKAPAPKTPAKPVEAQQKAPLKEGPQLEFKFKDHNFGELEEGPKAAVDFVFTNTGNKPLILTDVKASCGCTTPDWPKEPIQPGQTSKIKVEYNTQGRPGDFNKSITINSNANEGQPLMIYIKGKVNPSGKPAEHNHDHHGHDHNH